MDGVYLHYTLPSVRLRPSRRKRGAKPPPSPVFAAGAGGVVAAGGRAEAMARYDSPTISPLASRSIRAAAGFADNPGIVRISPQIG